MDNSCSLCRKEATLLRRLDRGKGRLRILDISAETYDAAQTGVSQEIASREIHGVMQDGTIIVGMEVFRRAYAAIGWGWLWAPTSWPLLRPLCDAAYRRFAKRRLKVCGGAAQDPKKSCATPQEK